MRITIQSIDGSESNWVVDFICNFGKGRGNWRVKKPFLNQEYDVEIDLISPLVLGSNCKTTNENKPQIQSSQDRTIIVAKISSNPSDCVAILQLEDALILADYLGEFPPIGNWIQITVPQINLFDTAIL